MAEVERKDSYTDLQDRLKEKEKKLAQKDKEFREAGGWDIIKGFSKEQRESFSHMTDQKQAEYLAKINPAAGRIWGEYAPMYRSKTALEKEVAEKKAKVEARAAAEPKLKKSLDLADKSAEQIKKLEQEVKEAEATVEMYRKTPRHTADVLAWKSMVSIKKEELEAAKKNLAEARKGINEAEKGKGKSKEAPKKEEPKKEATKKEVKDNSQKGNHGKKVVAAKKMTSRPDPIPQKVLDAAKEAGAHVVYLEDDKGNRIYQLRLGKEPKARTESVMTEMKGGEVLGPIDTKNFPEAKKLLNTARGRAGKSGADFSDVITELSGQVKTVELEEVKVVGQNKMKKPSLIQAPEVKAPELKDVKIKFTPTVTLVPHTKRNGKPSKRNFDIQLMDADGKIFILTKESFKKMVSEKGTNSAARAGTSWDAYIEAAKEGKLQPETVASFFKGQVNMGNDEKVVAADKEKETTEKGKNKTQELADQTKEALKGVDGVKIEVVKLTPEQMKQMKFGKDR